MKETKHAIWQAEGKWVVEPRDADTGEPRGDRLSFPARAAALLYIMKLDAPRLYDICAKMSFRHERAIVPAAMSDDDVRVDPFAFDRAFTAAVINAAMMVRAGKVQMLSSSTDMHRHAKVRSQSQPGETYDTSMTDCTCEAYVNQPRDSLEFGRYCKHTLAVRIASRYKCEEWEEDDQTPSSLPGLEAPPTMYH